MMYFWIVYAIVSIFTVLYIAYDRTSREFDFFPVGMLGGWFKVTILCLAFLFPPPFLYIHAKEHWDGRKIFKNNKR